MRKLEVIVNSRSNYPLLGLPLVRTFSKLNKMLLVQVYLKTQTEINLNKKSFLEKVYKSEYELPHYARRKHLCWHCCHWP